MKYKGFNIWCSSLPASKPYMVQSGYTIEYRAATMAAAKRWITKTVNAEHKGAMND